MVKDRDIRARIMAELEAAGVDKAYVNVVVANGAVELWGLVEAESQKRAHCDRGQEHEGREAGH